MIDFSKRILVSITGRKEADWKAKLKDINKRNINQVALFLEYFEPDVRERLYEALLLSKIQSIPLVHARNDMQKWEFNFLVGNFGSEMFNIHENSFRVLNKWKGYYKKLYLELNYDNRLARYVDVKKIGGFCIDLSHFKSEEERWTKEFEYVLKRRQIHRYFKCNHLNGYSPSKRNDLHTVRTLKDFSYLRTLPKFVFGKWIGIEVYNSIPEQLKFKSYLGKLLNERFR